MKTVWHGQESSAQKTRCNLNQKYPPQIKKIILVEKDDFDSVTQKMLSHEHRVTQKLLSQKYMTTNVISEEKIIKQKTGFA